MLITDEQTLHEDIAEYDIVGLANTYWDGLWMNRQQILTRLGKITTVLYARGPWLTWSYHKAIKESTLLGSFEIKDNVIVESSPLILPRIPKFPLLERLTLRLYAKRISAKIDSQSNKEKRLLYVFHPSYIDLIPYLRYDKIIYHCYDNFITMPEGDPDIADKEKRLCAIADHILTSSEENRDRIARDYDRSDTAFIPNGVDFDLFNITKTDPPDFLKNIKNSNPKIGYIGSVNDKVDLPLVDELTARCPEFNFVFVGRVNNLSVENAACWSRITARRNVYHFNSCSRFMVPHILRSMDVNCIYYDVSDGNFSSAGYPLKLHEYLASGKPAISAKIRSVMAFNDVVVTPDSADAWIEALNKAIENPDAAPSSSQLRFETARKNSWDARIEAIRHHVKRQAFT